MTKKKSKGGPNFFSKFYQFFGRFTRLVGLVASTLDHESSGPGSSPTTDSARADGAKVDPAYHPIPSGRENGYYPEIAISQIGWFGFHLKLGGSHLLYSYTDVRKGIRSETEA